MGNIKGDNRDDEAQADNGDTDRDMIQMCLLLFAGNTKSKLSCVNRLPKIILRDKIKHNIMIVRQALLLFTFY